MALSNEGEFPVDVIIALDQVSAGWLSAVLARSGALIDGAVVDFDVQGGRGNWSDNAILQLHYEAGSKEALPERLFLKMVDAGASTSDEFFGSSEVFYYAHDYLDVEDAPIIRCYDAAYSESARRYHLLLDDVSRTHVEASKRKPSLEYGLALAEGLATLHARWWGAKRLAQAGAPMHDADHIQRFVDIAQPGAGHIINHLSADLESHWPGLIRALYAGHPPVMIARTARVDGFTLIHGDVGHTNVLVPRVGHRPIYIIDRQPFDWSLTTWLGVYDLAYAIVLDWDIETRRQLEMPILERYYEHLLCKRVQGYSWEDLVDDYRLSAAMCVYIATEYCRGGVNERQKHVWLPMLQRALTACDDLACQDLW